MMKSAAVLALVGGVQSQSVSSCGAAGDHFSNVKITLSPDPPVLGQPFSATVEGDFDEVFAGGDANIDLNVKALGIINEPVKVSYPFTYSPGIASGHSTITVGPVNLPSIPLPGGVDVTGTVKLVDTKKEPVACINMDLKIGGASETSAVAAPEAKSTSAASPVTDCTKATDHMKNFKFATDASGVTTVTGTLDEDVAKVNVGVDLNIKVPLVPIPEIKLTVPASISPAIKQGDQKITVGPAASETAANPTPVTVSGNVKVNDGNSEEIVCLQISSSETDSTVVV
jgi:hypothetical protein